MQKPTNEIIKWVEQTLILAIAAAAATAISVIGNALFFTDVNWAQVGSAALLSFIVTILGRIAHIAGKGQLQRMKDRKPEQKG